MNWLAKLRTLTFIAGLALLLMLVGYWGLGRGQAQSLATFGEAPTFALIDQLERQVSSHDFRGKVVVANFIYTNCRDICPLLSFRMQQLQERLRQESLLGTRVQLLSLTVDPDHDTPMVLRAYAERHQADPLAWRFLTGPKDQLVPLIVQGFKLGVVALPPQQASPSGHEAGEAHEKPSEVMHSGRFVLIDRQGQIRAYYDGVQLDVDQVSRDIRQLLR